MAAFATPAAAETRAYALVLDGTWVNAHYERNFTGAIAVRVQRFMSATNPDHGEWVTITDDATT